MGKKYKELKTHKVNQYNHKAKRTANRTSGNPRGQQTVQAENQEDSKQYKRKTKMTANSTSGKTTANSISGKS